MLSDKQKAILAFPYTKYTALICDGAVRSGKTSLMMVAFIDWAMTNYNNVRFGICGKTVDSATKNMIAPYIGMTYAKRRYRLRWRRSDKILEVKKGKVTKANPDACIKCGQCEQRCPDYAIYLEKVEEGAN